MSYYDTINPECFEATRVVMRQDSSLSDVLRYLAVNEEILDDLATLGQMIASADAGPDEEQSQEQKDEAVRNQLEVVRRALDSVVNP